jgi:hypothetical protein
MVQTRSGKVWGFGRNFYGQLTAGAGGVGYGTPIATPYYLDISALRNSSDIAKLAVGADHTVMVFHDDAFGGTPDVLAVGSNVFGQLGSDSGLGLAVAEPLLAPLKEALGCAATKINGSADVGSCATGYMRAIAVSTGCDGTMLTIQRPECPPGTMSSDAGVQPCSICAGGSYQPSAAASTCLTCQQGLYSYAGSTACLTCASGTNTSSDNTDAGCLRICRKGEYGVKQQIGLQGLAPCTNCAVDYYTDQVGSYNCTQCPYLYGTNVTGKAAKTDCRRFCDEGYFSADGLESAWRPDDVYSATSMCSQCTAGKHQPQKRKNTCLGCPAGKFSVLASSSCSDCASGSYSGAANSSTCALCDYGKYQEETGQTSCSSCRLDMSTNALGARNQSDCRVTVFQVWGVGNNLWGQLGSGFVVSDTLLVNTNPIEVANDVGNPSKGLNNEQVLSVSAGYSHTLFLTTERQLWASGQNIYGQLGKPPLAASGCTLADESDLVCLQDPQVHVFPSSRNSVAPLKVDLIELKHVLAFTKATSVFSQSR